MSGLADPQESSMLGDSVPRMTVGEADGTFEGAVTAIRSLGP